MVTARNLSTRVLAGSAFFVLMRWRYTLREACKGSFALWSVVFAVTSLFVASFITWLSAGNVFGMLDTPEKLWSVGFEEISPFAFLAAFVALLCTAFYVARFVFSLSCWLARYSGVLHLLHEAGLRTTAAVWLSYIVYILLPPPSMSPTTADSVITTLLGMLVVLACTNYMLHFVSIDDI